MTLFLQVDTIVKFWSKKSAWIYHQCLEYVIIAHFEMNPSSISIQNYKHVPWHYRFWHYQNLVPTISKLLYAIDFVVAGPRRNPSLDPWVLLVPECPRNHKVIDEWIEHAFPLEGGFIKGNFKQHWKCKKISFQLAYVIWSNDICIFLQEKRMYLYIYAKNVPLLDSILHKN